MEMEHQELQKIIENMNVKQKGLLDHHWRESTNGSSEHRRNSGEKLFQEVRVLDDRISVE